MRGRCPWGATAVAAALALIAVGCGTSAVGPDPSAVTRPTTSTSTTAVPPVVSSTTTTVAPPPTTSAPAVKPRPTVPSPPPAVGTVSDAEAAVRARFGPAGDKAVAVARCESGLRPHASSGQYRGLFQISTRWHAARVARMGYTLDQLYDAAVNAHVAWAIWSEQGWRPWPVCGRR